MRKRLISWWQSFWEKKAWFIFLLFYKFFEDWGLGKFTEYVEKNRGTFLAYLIDYLPLATWVAIPIVIIFLIVKTWRDSAKTKGGTIPLVETIRDGIGEQYSTEVIDELDILIHRGNDLCENMQTKDFIREPLESVVGNWMNDIVRKVWQIIPKYASYIVGDQGNLTEHEKLPYQGWNWNDAALRISVDRRLLRLIEIRSQIQSADLDIENKEALQHVSIEERSHVNLAIHQGNAGWPVVYPIHIRNCRPYLIDIIGYNVTILWDGTPMQRIAWRAPSTEADNGLLVHPRFKGSDALPAITIQPDSKYQLDVPVNMKQIANWPEGSPRWTARGTFMFRCGNQTRDIQFDFNTDNYQFSDDKWHELRNHVLGSS